MSAEAIATDELWMGQALILADQAEAMGEVPVAALVVVDGVIAGTGHNRNILDHDPSAHAEIVALRAAGIALSNHRLVRATLYCTLEPCLMCIGAMIHARIARLVFAADDPKTGAVGSVFDPLGDARHNHQIDVVRGVLQEQASTRLQAFFKRKRSEDKERRNRG